MLLEVFFKELTIFFFSTEENSAANPPLESLTVSHKIVPVQYNEYVLQTIATSVVDPELKFRTRIKLIVKEYINKTVNSGLFVLLDSSIE